MADMSLSVPLTELLGQEFPTPPLLIHAELLRSLVCPLIKLRMLDQILSRLGIDDRGLDKRYRTPCPRNSSVTARRAASRAKAFTAKWLIGLNVSINARSIHSRASPPR